MKSPEIKLTMADGSQRIIRSTLGKDIRLTDRRFSQLFALIKNRPIRSNRLDHELIWLRECISVAEPDKTFVDTKEFITTVLDRIELHALRGTSRGIEGRKWRH